MALHVVRHAKAGSRPEWGLPDELRPVTDSGARQAEVLAEHLAAFPVQRILSSRFVRCLQTVEPLAARLGLEVEAHPALAEESDVERAWGLLEELAGTEAVLCSHGNIISPLLDRVHRRGILVEASEWTCHKGSVWRLEPDDRGGFARAVLAVAQA